MQLIFTVVEVAGLMGCSVKTVEDRARAGELPGLLWGDGGWRFPAQAFFERLNALAQEDAAVRRKRQVPTAIAGGPAQRRSAKALPVLPTLDGALRKNIHG